MIGTFYRVQCPIEEPGCAYMVGWELARISHQMDEPSLDL